MTPGLRLSVSDSKLKVRQRQMPEHTIHLIGGRRKGSADEKWQTKRVRRQTKTKGVRPEWRLDKPRVKMAEVIIGVVEKQKRACDGVAG